MASCDGGWWDELGSGAMRRGEHLEWKKDWVVVRLMREECGGREREKWITRGQRYAWSG